MRERIDPTRAADRVEPGDPWAYDDGPAPPNSHGPRNPAGTGGTSTTHLCAVDRERNTVSLTQTVVDAFGSGLIVPGTGVVLNNAMQWFDVARGHCRGLLRGRGFRVRTPGQEVDREG